MVQLSWRHHAVVQALLSRGPLPENDLHSIFAGVSGKNPEQHQELFNQFLLAINKELAFLQFELRGCRNQYDGQIYYGIVNNVADEQSKLGTKYSVPQIAFYKAIIEAITQDPRAQGCISNINVLNIQLENHASSSSQDESVVPNAFKNFSLSQKEGTIHELIHDGWLCSTSDGSIGLGQRSFLDLRSWFRGNDIPSCEVCNEAAVKAELCSNEDCSVRMHDYCLKKRFSRKKVARICPECSTPWNVTETDNGDEDKENDPSHTQQPDAHSARDRQKRCKAEKAEIAQAQSNPSSDPPPAMKKRLRSFQGENHDVAENPVNSECASSNVPVRRSKRFGIRA